jgi:CHAP domain
MAEKAVIERVRKIMLGEAAKSAAKAPGAIRSPLGSNNVKYNTAFYGKEVSDPAGELFRWCVVFIWWSMRQADVGQAIFPKVASVFKAENANVRDFFKERNRFHPATATPVVGDLVIFKFSHIGFVEAVDAVNIKTIEGNVNSRVIRTTHPRSSSSIDGYCRPAYSKAEGGLSMADAQDILRELAEMKRQIDLLYRRANHGDADRSPFEAGGDFNRKAIETTVKKIADDVKALRDAHPHT